MNFLTEHSRRHHLCFHSSSCSYMGVLHCLVLWWVLGIGPVLLGHLMGTEGKSSLRPWLIFMCRKAQIWGGHLSACSLHCYSCSGPVILLQPTNSCIPLHLSLFPQKASSQGVLAVSVLNFCLLVPPPVRASDYKLSGQVLYHLYGVSCPPPSPPINLQNNFIAVAWEPLVSLLM